jgi:MFS family permease
LATGISQTALAAAEPAPRFAALRNPTFRLYWLATVSSALGDISEAVVRNWLVWELTKSPFWLGIANFCHWLPFSLLCLHAGVWADRVNNRKLVRLSEFFYLASAVSMGLIVLAGTIQLWVVLALLILHGTGGGMSQPSRMVLVHNMVGKEALLNAISLSSSARHSLQVIGPPLAALALVSIGVGWAYLIIGALFLPLIVTLTTMRIVEPPRAVNGESPSAWRSLKEGFQYVRSNPVPLSLLALAATPTILIGSSFQSMLPYFAERVFGMGAQGYSFLLAATGVGASVGALGLSCMRSITHKGAVVVGFTLAYALFVIAFASFSWYVPVVVASLFLVAYGASFVIHQASLNTLLLMVAPEAVRGRVMGLYSMSVFGLQIFNGPAVGTLAVIIGMSSALSLVGTMIVVITFTIALKIPALRRLD